MQNSSILAVVLGWVLMILSGNICLAQYSSPLVDRGEYWESSIRNQTGNLIFDVRFYKKDKVYGVGRVSQGIIDGWYSWFGWETYDLKARENLPNAYREPVLQSFLYWTEVLYPNSAPEKHAVINIGYGDQHGLAATGEDDIEESAMAAPYRDGTGYSQYIWNVWTNNPTSDSDGNPHLIRNVPYDAHVMLGTDLNWHAEANGNLFGYSAKGYSIEAVVIHEIGHGFGLDKTIFKQMNLLNTNNREDVEYVGTNALSVWQWRDNGQYNGNIPMALGSDQSSDHFGFQNGLMTHMRWRNYSGMMEAEMAVMLDLGYTVDLKNFFGQSVYTNHNTFTYRNGFFKSNGIAKDASGNIKHNYNENESNASTYAIGLHLYGNYNNVTVAEKNILAGGHGAAGIRVDGFRNTVTVDHGVKVEANGSQGTGLLVAFGNNHHIVNNGTITATGEGGVAVRFDFGPGYRKYDPPSSYGKYYDVNNNLQDLNGPLVEQFDINGSIYGQKAAVYIGEGAYVKQININAGSKISGDILSDYVKADKKLQNTELVFDAKYFFVDGSFAGIKYDGKIQGDFDLVTKSGYTWLSGPDLVFANGTIEKGTILDLYDYGSGGTATFKGDLTVKKGAAVTSPVPYFEKEWLDKDYTELMVASDDWTRTDLRNLTVEGDVKNAGFICWFSKVTINRNLINTGVIFNTDTITVKGKGGIKNEDEFIINGKIYSDALENHGTLRGAGEVATRDGVYNYYLIAPGNSIGTFTIGGHFTNESTGILEIETKPSANPVPGVDNDLLKVKYNSIDGIDGIAIINGGYVLVKDEGLDTFNAAGYADGTKYTFLTAEDGITVNKEFTAVDASPLYDYFTAGYDTYNYWVIFNSTPERDYVYEQFGDTFNQRGIGRSIDILGRFGNVAAGSDFSIVLRTLDNVNTGIGHRQGISAAAKFALDQMGGSIYGSLAQAGIQNTAAVNDVLGNALRNAADETNRQGTYRYQSADSYGDDVCCDPCSPCNPCDPISVTKTNRRRTWGLGFSAGGESQFDGNAYGYRQHFGGTVIGIDRPFRKNDRLGAFFSYGQGSIRSELQDKSESQEILAGLYLYRNLYAGYIMTSAGLGNKHYDTERTLSFMNRLARNKHNAFSGTWYLERGWNMNNRSNYWQPYAGLQYAGLRQERFTENGAGSLNLSADSAVTNSLRSVFGLRLNTSPMIRGVRFSGSAAWIHEFLDPHTDFTAAFSDPAGIKVTQGAKFTVRGNDFGRDWAKLGLGLNYQRNSRLRFFAGYDAYLNTEQVWHTGNAGAVCEW